MPEVREYEDPRALIGGGKDGLDVIRCILTLAPTVLSSDADVWLETHGTHEQREKLDEFVQRSCPRLQVQGWYEDFAGKPRFVHLVSR